jgi:FdhD protein
MVQPAAAARATAPGAPRLSAAVSPLLRSIRSVDEKGRERSIDLPCERPLTILLDGRELVTLMTLGASPELLVLGYLRNQRLIDDVAQLESLDVDWASSSAHVKLRAPGAQDVVATDARSPGSSGCSLGTGFADVMRDATAPLPTVLPARIAAATVLRVLEVMRQHDAIHRAAGSVHSCALFCGADLWVSVEDVSRHNGVDTITGWMALHEVTGAGNILFTTGRLTGEMVLKAAHNGVPIMVSRNGVTAMGYELAMRLRMTLLGRAANRRFVCYTGTDRLDF